MLGERPSDAYRTYQSRNKRDPQSGPVRKRRGRLIEAAIVAIILIAGGFVVLFGFWAFTLGGQQAKPEVKPTPTVGDRQLGLLGVLVQSEIGSPLSGAIVEFRDRLDQIVAIERTNLKGHAGTSVPVGADYSIAVRIPGYNVARLLDVEVTEKDSPRLVVIAKPATVSPLRTPVARFATESRQSMPALSSRIGASDVIGAPPMLANRDQASPTASREIPRVPNNGGLAPQLIVVHPQGRFTTIDVASNLILNRIGLLGWQSRPLIDPVFSHQMIWLSQRGGNRILALDPRNMTVIKAIPLEGLAITGLVAQPRGDRIWVGGVKVGAQISGRVIEVSAKPASFGTILRRINVPAVISDLASRTDGGMLYLLHRRIGRLSFVRPSDGKVVRSAPILESSLAQPNYRAGQSSRGLMRTHFAVSPDQSELFFVNATRERIIAISASTGEPTRVLDVGEGIAAIRVHPHGNHLYVANRMLGLVQLVDLETAQIVDTIPVGQNPQSVTFSPDGARAYVVNQGSATISVIDIVERRVSDLIELQSTPLSLIYIA